MSKDKVLRKILSWMCIEGISHIFTLKMSVFSGKKKKSLRLNKDKVVSH